MRTYAEQTSVKNTALQPNNSQSAGAGILPADQRPETVAQLKLQQLASTHTPALVVQRKPLSDELTVTEEKDIQDALNQQNYNRAVQLLHQSDLFHRIDSGNIQTVSYDAHLSNYAEARQARRNPAANNGVDLVFGALALQSVPVLVSTFMHEMLHAKQYTQKAMDDKHLQPVVHIYGYAVQKQHHLYEAQEVEAYSLEILNAVSIGTSTDAAFMKDRGLGLSAHYAALYALVNVGGNKSKAKSTKGQLLDSVRTRYLQALQPTVEQAYLELQRLGVDTSGYFRKGLASYQPPAPVNNNNNNNAAVPVGGTTAPSGRPAKKQKRNP